jgi:hypothetical protein
MLREGLNCTRRGCWRLYFVPGKADRLKGTRGRIQGDGWSVPLITRNILNTSRADHTRSCELLLSHYSAITRVCGTDLGEFQGGSENNSGGTASGEEKVRGGLAESFDPSRPVSVSRARGGTARPDGKPLTPSLRPAAADSGNPAPRPAGNRRHERSHSPLRFHSR